MVVKCPVGICPTIHVEYLQSIAEINHGTQQTLSPLKPLWVGGGGGGVQCALTARRPWRIINRIEICHKNVFVIFLVLVSSFQKYKNEKYLFRER